MTEIIDNLKADMTGRRKVRKEPCGVIVTDDTANTSKAPAIMNEYNINFSWNQRIHCLPKDLNNMLDNTIRDIKEVIYGDSRKRLLELEGFVCAGEQKKAVMVIRDLLREFF